jgi:hypothetical protein
LAKQKHFLVSRVIEPDLPTDPVVSVEIEAVFSKATLVIAWRELQDHSVWRQDYQLVRPHSSLVRIPPARFSEQHRHVLSNS